MKYVAIIFLGTFLIIGVLYVMSRDAHPNSSLFSIKRLEEKIILATKRTPEAKADYLSSLLDKRLRDIEYVYKAKQYQFILSTSLRYSTTAGHLTEVIKNNNLKKESAETKKKFSEHQKELNEMLLTFPRNKGDGWKFITDDINYLDIYRGQLP